jgi:hypothetical protein
MEGSGMADWSRLSLATEWSGGDCGISEAGRREHERERERTAGRTVHQKSVYVYTMVLYSSRDLNYHLSVK